MLLQSLAFTVLTKKFVGLSSLSLGVIAMTVDPMVFSAAAVVVIGAIAAAAVKIINALASAKKELIELQLLTAGKIDVVSGHVDGMRTRADEKHSSDVDTIASLKKQLSDSETRAAMLAQAKATVEASSVVVQAAVAGASIPAKKEPV